MEYKSIGIFKKEGRKARKIEISIKRDTLTRNRLSKENLLSPRTINPEPTKNYLEKRDV